MKKLLITATLALVSLSQMSMAQSIDSCGSNNSCLAKAISKQLDDSDKKLTKKLNRILKELKIDDLDEEQDQPYCPGDAIRAKDGISCLTMSLSTDSCSTTCKKIGLPGGATKISSAEECLSFFKAKIGYQSELKYSYNYDFQFSCIISNGKVFYKSAEGGYSSSGTGYVQACSCNKY